MHRFVYRACIRGIDESHLHTVGGKAQEQAGGIAEQEGTGDKVVALAQQREQEGSDRRHAGCKAQRCDALFHGGDLRLQGFDGWIDLPAVSESRARALKYRCQIVRIVVSVSHGRVHGLVHRAMLDVSLAVAVDDLARKTFHWPGIFRNDGRTIRRPAAQKSRCAAIYRLRLRAARQQILALQPPERRKTSGNRVVLA